ncbi:hypothetical protein [Rufibacter sp. LB8]|uniref:hypothetical protein n=1 Tax=Rufibacter sp. LB8 TaxID=2777781 RepID=UPI00178C2A9C|nr:hypothetical protein [Rufibacter sp. LB8]
MKINKYLPFVLLYFFFNSVFLPIGLMYTTLLTPLFYLWLNVNGQRFVILKFLLPLVPFVLIHFVNGVDALIYGKSAALFFTAYIFVYALVVLLKKVDYVEDWFIKITKLNAVLTVVAIILFFTPYIRTLWTVQNLTMGVSNFPRLSLLTYEPSYYSTLLVPLIAYFALDAIQFKRRSSLNYLVLLLVSLVLSFSIGVIACLVVSLFLVAVVNNRALSINRNYVRPLLFSLCLGLLASGVWVALNPDNALVVRVNNVLDGKDGSGKGRTSEAFYLAQKIADEKSTLWGAGLGQIKVLGEFIIRPYYRYVKADVPVTTIPNSSAETLAIFGMLGFWGRILVQVYLFFKTRVWTSSFRTMVFFYIFLYQFTGSFIVNIAEYVIWVFAFVPVFYQFEKRRHDLVLEEKIT